MNPASTARFRRVTGLLLASWALLAIGLSCFALFIPQRGPVFPLTNSVIAGAAIVHTATREALQSGVEPGDRVLSVDGLAMSRVYRMWHSGRLLEEGKANLYEIEKRDGEVLRVELLPARPTEMTSAKDVLVNAGLLAVSAFYLGIGLLVWRNRPANAEAWALLLFCSTMAVQLASAIRVEAIPWSASRILANLPMLGATTFHLFTTYPVEPGWIVRHRRIRVVPYALAIAISLGVFFDSALGLPSDWIGGIAFFYGVGLSLLSLGILAAEHRRARHTALGDRADVMLAAGTISFLPALLVLIVEYFLQRPFASAAMLWVVFFPIAVAYGMVKKDLFEFRLMARSSAAYGFATLAITGVFAFLISSADALVAQVGVTERALQVIFLFIAILAFNPLRERMQGLVDRLFDRDRSRYRAVMREISEAMVSMLSLREIGDRILVGLTDTMGVERAMVLLFDEGDRVLRPTAWRGDWEDDDIDTEIPSDHPIWKQLWMRREELSRVDFDDEADPERRELCRDVFDTLEVELLVPILFGVDLLGVVAVGRKLSGERLAADDRQLVRTLANQSAIAIENAKAFDEIASLNETLEARVDERTRELRETQAQLLQSEKLNTMGQLVAGVAHELNNPIGIVHANLQLLDEFIQKLTDSPQSESDTERIRDAIGKLLLRSREGTHRVKEIVQDLRTFSRMDQPELQTVNLHEEIDRTLALMEPRFKGGIEVVREYGEIPNVHCYPGQLVQVFLNLLVNACDVLEGGGTITIRTGPSDLGVRLQFSDSGPGIPADVQNRIFDPFFTTKEVGKGTGLGLSLSHGIIERHRGRIFVGSETGQGATFVIDLPLDATPADE